MADRLHSTRRALLKAAAAATFAAPLALSPEPAAAAVVPFTTDHEHAELLLGYYAFLVVEAARLERELAIPHMHPDALAAGEAKAAELSAAAEPIHRARMLEVISRGWVICRA